jgi:hypothetical protein
MQMHGERPAVGATAAMDRARAAPSWSGSGGRGPADQFQDLGHGDQLAHGPEIDGRHENLHSRAIMRNREEEPVSPSQREQHRRHLCEHACAIKIDAIKTLDILVARGQLLCLRLGRWGGRKGSHARVARGQLHSTPCAWGENGPAREKTL